MGLVWPSNQAAPRAEWRHLTDVDGTQPHGWFTSVANGMRTVVKGYPTWNDAPFDIPASARRHDQDYEYRHLRAAFDLVYTTYVFPDVDTAGGPSTHTFANLDFVGGWEPPVSHVTGLRPDEAFFERTIRGAKPASELIVQEVDAEKWVAASQSVGLGTIAYRDHFNRTRLWVAPARLSDRVDQAVLAATWEALAAADPDGVRGDRILRAVDLGLKQAFSLDLLQEPVTRGVDRRLAWWDEDSAEGWVVLGAVLGYPPASTYDRIGGSL